MLVFSILYAISIFCIIGSVFSVSILGFDIEESPVLKRVAYYGMSLFMIANICFIVAELFPIAI